MKIFRYKTKGYSAWQYTHFFCWLMNLIDVRYRWCDCHYQPPYGKVISADCKKHDMKKPNPISVCAIVVVCLIIVLGMGGLIYAKYRQQWYKPAEKKIHYIPRQDAEKALGAKIPLDSPRDLQRRINEILIKAGKPPIKVDGKIGRETIKAYYEVFCHEQGLYACKRAGM